MEFSKLFLNDFLSLDTHEQAFIMAQLLACFGTLFDDLDYDHITKEKLYQTIQDSITAAKNSRLQNGVI